MTVAMILAAGRGERLKPFTNSHPKALCIVRGKPLIEHHVINLAAAGYKKIVINHAYLGGQIRHYLGNGSRFGVELCYSPEPPGGLETGGGIVLALPFFEGQPFITVNADIYTDFNFATINLDTVEYMHLILVAKNEALKQHGDFGLINHIEPTNATPSHTFSGIIGYHPRVFADSPIGRYSVTPLIRQCVAEKKATAFCHQGIWFDIGNVARWQAANGVDVI
jgi:MurNAc alpha-1-phosphate uridylyltransferase